MSMSDKFVMLAKSFDHKTFDPKGYWLSQKWNGIRFFHRNGKLLTRYGNVIDVPKFWFEGLPNNINYDGELVLPDGTLQETKSIVSTHGKDKGWSRINAMLFDVVDMTKLFEQRYQDLKEACANITAPYVHCLQHAQCPNREFMIDAFNKIVANGGEGIVLRAPKSRYTLTRSMLKWRKFFDGEGRVIGYEEGGGKYVGVMGTLIVEALANPSAGVYAVKEGTVVRIGTGFTDAERANPPSKGTIINYQYSEIVEKSGKPFHPSYGGVK